MKVKRTTILLAIGSLLITGGIYFESLSGAFIWDDHSLIVNDDFVKDLKRIAYLFSPEYWLFHHGGAKGQYRPLRAVTFSITNAILGNDPMAYRALNLILYLVDCILVFIITMKIFRKEDLALVAMAIFAFHPVHVEAVCWIKNRSEIMALAFLLLSWLLLLLYFDRRWGKASLWLFLSLFLFALALLSKEMAMTFPLVLSAWIILRRKEGYPFPLEATIPFWIILVIYLLYLFLFLHPLKSDMPDVEMNVFSRTAVVLKTFHHYVGTVIFPFHLSADYAFSYPSSIFDIGSIGGAIIILCLVFLVLIFWRKEPFISFSIVFFAITLLPVLNVKILGGRPIADQRLFVPSIGFCWALSIAVSRIKGRGLPYIITAGLIAFYGTITARQVSYWEDDFTLFRETVKRSPELERPHYNLGTAYGEKGMLREAEHEFRKAIAIRPDHAKSYMGLGKVYERLGKRNGAIDYYKKAISLDPDLVEAKNSLGRIYMKEGRLALAREAFKESIRSEPTGIGAHMAIAEIDEEEGKSDDALSTYRMVLNIRPDHPVALRRMGKLLIKLGRYSDALPVYQRLLALDTRDLEAKKDLGFVYNKLGMYDLALAIFREIIERDRGNWALHYHMGFSLASQGLIDQAMGYYREAIRLNPHCAEAHNAIGELYARKGLIVDAEKAYREALRVNPNLAEALNNLGILKESLGDIEGARRAYHDALKLRPRYALPLFNLGNIAMRHGRLEEARRYFEKALQLDSSLFKAWNNLGNVLVRLGKTEDAERAYRSALRERPEFAQAHFNLGNLLYMKNRPQEAKREYEEALKVNPGHAKAWLHLGMILLQEKNDPERAIECLRRSLELDPDQENSAKIREIVSGIAKKGSISRGGGTP